jgi:hypothetical protein
VIGENGAFYFRYDRSARRMQRRFARSESERQQDVARLAAIERQVLAEVAGAAVAADQAYRVADLAIDYCEDVPPLPAESVARIVAIFTSHGATAKVSSIHVNGWFGDFDKLSTTRLFMAEALGLNIDESANRIVFVGDSPNDAPMFGFFQNSVGVANVLRFAATLTQKPTWVTTGTGGGGFAELAEALLIGR